jgi:hypothetical protein
MATLISSPKFEDAIKVATDIARRRGVELTPLTRGAGFQTEALPDGLAAALRTELLVSGVRLNIDGVNRLILTPGV